MVKDKCGCCVTLQHPLQIKAKVLFSFYGASLEISKVLLIFKFQLRKHLEYAFMIYRSTNLISYMYFC